MQFGVNPDNKFAAVSFSRGRRRQRLAIAFNDIHPLLGSFAELSVNIGFVVAVDTTVKQPRAASDEAFVLVGPFDDFQITGCFDFTFGGFHGCFLGGLTASMAAS